MMLLQELLVGYYAPLKGISDRTLQLYGYTIASFSEVLGRPATVADFEELSIARFLAHRVRTREPATAAKDRAQLRALWEFAARRKLCDTWPTIPLIRVPERVPEAWMSDEFQRLVNQASLERTSVAGIPGGLWWVAILRLCYDSGERIGSVMQLRWKFVRGCTVVFRAEGRKGCRRDILREISVETADALLAIKGSRGPEDLVFPWGCGRGYVWKRLEILLKRAGLPSGRKDKFHKIRKTTASYYEAAGGSAQRLLDHADPATTRKYLDPRIVKGQSAPDVIPPIARPPAAAG